MPNGTRREIKWTALGAVLLTGFCFDLFPADSTTEPVPKESVVNLRAWGVPSDSGSDPASLAGMEVLAAFEQRFPHIKPYSPTGLEIAGRSMDIVPLMQIAGNIAPDVLYVNFRQSSTYIANKFLYPLDKYVEKAVGVDIKDGHTLELADYIAQLKKGKNYETELSPERVIPQCWEVMRRRCPYGKDCPYVHAWGGTSAEEHQHIWCFPQMPAVVALFYRKDLFFNAGLPNRAPATMDEFLDWSRKLTNPKENHYGIKMGLDGWSTLAFLYSSGGRLIDRDAQGHWICAFDTEAAVDAYYFVMRLFYEPFENQYGHFNSVVYLGDEPFDTIPVAMHFSYLGPITFAYDNFDPALWNYGPAPKGRNGQSGSELNAQMTGIYAGLENNPTQRDAAWEYMRFYNGPEARRIRTRVLVENGMGQFIHPSLLRDAGYPEFIKQAPAGWEDAYTETVKNGVPEPYGENSQLIYRYASQAIDQIRTDSVAIDAVQRGDEKAAKARIREILKSRVTYSNEKMLDIRTPEMRTFRSRVAMAVAIAILLAFTLVFWSVFTTFSSKGDVQPSGWKIRQHTWAYVWLFPAILSIAVWEYYPLARGTLMAFQNYNVRGFSDWVGLDNFASVLFDQEFWYALWVSLQYAVLSMLFGFCAPIVLAFLLSEVPRGKTLFRTIYYLPAVLSGVIVIFLWKSFYSQDGLLNDVVNFFVRLATSCPAFIFQNITQPGSIHRWRR